MDRRRILASIGAFLTIFLYSFCVTKVALSHAQTQPLEPSRNLQVQDISIPATLGYVLETHKPTGAQSQKAPIIVHIQDAHTNYEAQKNIIQILEELVKTHGLKLILVEGSAGDASLSYLRDYAPLERRKEVSEKYLKAGIISAEEYLDVVSEYPLIIWGIEDKELYDSNVEAFLAAEPLQRSLLPILASVREAAEELTSDISDPRLAGLEAEAKAFESDKISLGNYVGFLAPLAKEVDISMEGRPNLKRFMDVRRLEGQIETSRVQKEQQEIIGQLSQKSSEADLEKLVEEATDLKEGKIKPVDFYTTLEQLANKAEVGFAGCPQLSRYIRYVQESAQIDPAELSQELEKLSADLRGRLSSTSESRQLTRILKEVGLTEKLLSFNLSPQERKKLNSIDLKEAFSRWADFLNRELSLYGYQTHSFQNLGRLEAELPNLRRFYELAERRDEVLVKNALSKLRETQEPIAVLITGGFHSPQITRLLKKKGVATVVLAPKVGQATNEQLYRAVVKYKSGHGGSFEEVMAIAEEQAPNSKSQIPSKHQ